MANENTIAQAYVQVMPSMEGISGQLSGAFTKEVNSAAKGAEGGFTIIKGAMANLVAQGISAAVNGVKNLASSVVATGQTFETSMSQVMATMGRLDGTDEELAAIARAAKQIGIEVDTTASATDQAAAVLSAFAKQQGESTAFSASQAADALNYMALAGYDVEKSVGMLPNVLNLAAAGNIDLAYASDMVTDASSALGLSTEETTAMVDQMAKASSKSNTSVSQLGEAFLKIGATARSVKGGTQELSTVLGVLADNGIKGSEGGTHLRNMLLSLQSAADNGVVSFGDFNVAIYDADGNMRSMIDIIGDMQDGMAGMTQESKDAMISGVFNKTDLASVNALLGTSSDRFDELSEAISNAGGAAEEMANTQLNNLSGDLTLLNSAWEGFQLQLYDTVNGPMREIVQTVTNELIPALGDLVNGVDGAGEEIGAAVGNIFTQVIETGAQMLPEIINMVISLVESVALALAENAPTIVDTVIAAIPQIISSVLSLLPVILGAVMEIIVAVINGIAEMAPQIIQAVIDIIPVLIDSLLEHLPDMLDAAITLLMAIVEAIPTIIDRLLENLPHIIETILNGVLDALPELLDAAITLFMAIVEAIPTIIDSLIQHLPEIIDTIITTLLDHIDDILNGAITLLMAIIQAIPTIISTLVVKIPEIVTTIVTTLLDHLPELIVGAVQLFMGIIEAIPQILIELASNMPQIITAIVNGLLDGLSRITDVGWSLLEGLWNGISQAASWLWNKVYGWATGLLNSIKSIFGIHSPSRVFAGFGEMMSAGLGEGIEDGAHYAIDAVNEMSDGILDAISDTDLDLNSKVSLSATDALSKKAGYDSTTEGSRTATNYTITFNVYGAEGQDEEVLARKIMEMIQELTDRRNLIYA